MIFMRLAYGAAVAARSRVLCGLGLAGRYTAAMKLRTRLNLIVAGLTAMFVAVLIFAEIEDTRSSVNEEVEAANRVGSQLLGRLAAIYSREGDTETVRQFLVQLGHVRANDVVLRAPSGELLYRSPDATYKAGREAPELVCAAPGAARSPKEHSASKGGVQLVITANASRAILDAWDNFQKLFVVGAVMLVLVNGLVFWLVKLALAPFPVITAGLQRSGTRRSGLPLAAACRIRGSQHRIGVQSHGAGS